MNHESLKGIHRDLCFLNILCPYKCQCAYLKLFFLETGRIKKNDGVGEFS
jgi:hypothetical protein